ncbi:peptidyl-prolyl cis-trans isomerase [Alkalicoccus luteus]|uniref:Peptidyl-prolyl cis-trans isomerase n=1 Tax=Alkalicoccus luteus TaxID=1237094 RepID=A0A969PPB2_9BACI|nr:peptidyl-prolyl cis-trans isomerase [Alkalicoccus luteus]NJP36479.1 peptidyl-prolyl cis-trans isomerase [Alkalicoccus luteus]
MAEMLVKIVGNVKHPVMLDPGTWIFDERRIDMEKAFDQSAESESNESFAALGKAFDRQRTEGAVPQQQTNKITVSRKDMQEKSFGIRLRPFLLNSSPDETADTVKFIRASDADVTLTLEEAGEGILQFSHKGSPLTEDGPVHFFYSDGSNRDNPITGIERIEVL